MMCMEDHMYMMDVYGGPHVHDVYGGPHVHDVNGRYIMRPHGCLH